jgi:hypothetical protein
MFSKVHILSVRIHVNLLFSRKKFANCGFVERATVNSPNSFAGRRIAVVHIGEMKKKNESFWEDNLKKDFYGKRAMVSVNNIVKKKFISSMSTLFIFS